MVDPVYLILNGGPIMPLLLLMGLLQMAGVALQILMRARIDIMPLLWMGIVCTILLGILGSVMGAIIAFDAVAKASEEVKQAMVASGISVALFTTAMSLMVAIPGAFFTAIAGSVVASTRDRTEAPAGAAV